MTACGTTNPLDTGPSVEQSARCGGDNDQLDLSDNVLEIDQRGRYDPRRFDCSHRPQPRPDDWQEPAANCPKLMVPEGSGLSSWEINNFGALECQIHRTITDLLNDPDHPGHPQHLVLFVHGGLVTPEEALARAREDIPLMDHTPPDPGFMSGLKIFPMFYIWPSGFFSAYTDATVNYAQGEYDSPLRRAGTPLYFGTDVAETAAKAPLELVKSIKRFSDAYLHTTDEPSKFGCELGPRHFACNDIGELDPSFGDLAVYGAVTPLRVVTTPSLDTATSAWKNMVARTRFAFSRYVDPAEFRAAGDGKIIPGPGHNYSPRDVLSHGALYFFFDALQDAIAREPHQCGPDALRITVIGHSMGEMVLNELMENFPQLPYENIVYMAAAGSIRDFKAMTEPVLHAPRCADLRLYNLTLHPVAERRDLEWYGLAPLGSLLEWIDDIFETPVTPLDRTLGKWENDVYAENAFDGAAMNRMYLHRFGLEAPDPLMHGEFAGALSGRTKPGEVCPAWQYWQPEFWSVVTTASDKPRHCACRSMSTGRDWDCTQPPN